MESFREIKDINRIEESLPREVYYQCIWIVRDTERLRRLAEMGTAADLSQSLVFFDMGTGNSVRLEVTKRAEWVLDCIDNALESVPEAYRQGIIDNIIKRQDFDDIAHPNTWKKWKRVFVYHLAHQLKMV